MNNLKQTVKISAICITVAMGFICANYQGNCQDTTRTIKDRDGNSYTIKKMPDNNIWMTANLSINIPGSYCYEDNAQNCKQYGRLYKWKAAQEGCRLLGEGWRLPTNEEWEQLAGWYGGPRDNSKDSGRAAYKELVDGGSAAFNILLGGGRNLFDSIYARMGAHGFYWTATEADNGHAWFYNFGKNLRMLNRHKDGEKPRAFSVRCIRNTASLNSQ